MENLAEEAGAAARVIPEGCVANDAPFYAFSGRIRKLWETV